jgi:hypothetical protein
MVDSRAQISWRKQPKRARSTELVAGMLRAAIQVLPRGLVASVWLLILPTLLIAGNLLNQASAQEATAIPGPRYPDGSNITVEWTYSCQNNKSCSFNCPGSGGATHVSKLTIWLGTVPVGSLKQVPALMYNFMTSELQPGNGFVFGTGLGALSCQVNGMALDYSGPPKSAK